MTGYNELASQESSNNCFSSASITKERTRLVCRTVRPYISGSEYIR